MMCNRSLTLNKITLSAFLLSLAATTPVLAETTGQYIDDATISTKVKAAIIGDKVLHDTDISVETDKASVQLTGMVNTKAQEDQAVRDAKLITGVREVQNHLTIRSSQEE